MPKAGDLYLVRCLGAVCVTLVLFGSVFLSSSETARRRGFALVPAHQPGEATVDRAEEAIVLTPPSPPVIEDCLKDLTVWASTSFFESDYRVGSVIEVAIELDRSACDCSELRLEWLEWTSYVEESMAYTGVQPFRWQDHRVLNPIAGGMWRQWDRALSKVGAGPQRIRITDIPAVTRRKWVNGEWHGFDRDRLLLIEVRVTCVPANPDARPTQLSYGVVQHIQVQDGAYVGGLLHVASGPLDWTRWTGPYETAQQPATTVALRDP
jgi:hypothetical protein